MCPGRETPLTLVPYVICKSTRIQDYCSFIYFIIYWVANILNLKYWFIPFVLSLRYHMAQVFP
jgi:hypothetical protein